MPGGLNNERMCEAMLLFSKQTSAFILAGFWLFSVYSSFTHLPLEGHLVVSSLGKIQIWSLYLFMYKLSCEYRF